MNSFSGNGSQRTPSSSAAASFGSYQFDFGIAGSGRSSASRPLRDQKPNPAAAPASNTASRPSTTAWSHQPSKQSWTHQPATSVGAGAGVRSGNLAGAPSSMVGDIFGKSWNAAAPTSSGIGIAKPDPNLFKDLVGSALGQGRGADANVPLKSAAPKNTFSVSNLSASLPKSTPTTTNSTNPAATASNTPMRSSSWGSEESYGKFASFTQSGGKTRTPIGGGGQPLKSAAGVPPMNAKKDPFGSLMDFGSKPAAKAPISSANSTNTSSGIGAGDDFSFGAFQNANSIKANDTGMQGQSFSSAPPPQPEPAPTKAAADPMDMFFASSASAAAPPVGAASDASGTQPFSEMNDWDLGSEFSAHDSTGPTVELEGLPPPPAGVTASAAKSKGLDNYKQGQFADAIKWLSWAVVLLEKTSNSTSEVLICRASCYKEVGEYKKAVADCSKVLEQDSSNVDVLVQRALLYESMEKYKLGAEDLRMVLKIDPGNRLARSSIHRFSKFAD